MLIKGAGTEEKLNLLVYLSSPGPDGQCPDSEDALRNLESAPVRQNLRIRLSHIGGVARQTQFPANLRFIWSCLTVGCTTSSKESTHSSIRVPSSVVALDAGLAEDQLQHMQALLCHSARIYIGHRVSGRVSSGQGCQCCWCLPGQLSIGVWAQIRAVISVGVGRDVDFDHHSPRSSSLSSMPSHSALSPCSHPPLSKLTLITSPSPRLLSLSLSCPMLCSSPAVLQHVLVFA